MAPFTNAANKAIPARTIIAVSMPAISAFSVAGVQLPGALQYSSRRDRAGRRACGDCRIFSERRISLKKRALYGSAAVHCQVGGTLSTKQCRLLRGPARTRADTPAFTDRVSALTRSGGCAVCRWSSRFRRRGPKDLRPKHLRPKNLGSKHLRAKHLRGSKPGSVGRGLRGK